MLLSLSHLLQKTTSSFLLLKTVLLSLLLLRMLLHSALFTISVLPWVLGLFNLVQTVFRSCQVLGMLRECFLQKP
jgi:hypothetical protein